MRNRSRSLLAAATVVVLLAALIGFIYYRRSRPPDAQALGVPILVGNTAYLTDGSTVSLHVGDGARISQLTSVPGGLVFSAFDENRDESHIWFRPNDGGLEPLGTAGNLPFTVARDGRTLIAVGMPKDDPANETDAERDADYARVTAFDLTTGAVRATTQFANATVADAIGDWVLLQAFDGALKRPAELWDVRSGKTTPFARLDNVTAFAVTSSGQVFRRVDLPPPGDNTYDACYDLVTPGTTVPTDFSGLCGDKDIFDALLSSDGRHLFAVTHDSAYIVNVADLLHSRWSAVVVRFDDVGPTSETYWASNTSIITPYGDRFEHCDNSGACKTHHISGGGLVGFTYPAA